MMRQQLNHQVQRRERSNVTGSVLHIEIVIRAHGRCIDVSEKDRYQGA